MMNSAVDSEFWPLVDALKPGLDTLTKLK